LPPACDPGAPYRKLDVSTWSRARREMEFALAVERAVCSGEFDLSVGMGKTLGCDVVRPGGGLHTTWFEQDLRSFQSRVAGLLRMIMRRLSAKQRISFRLDREMYRHPRLKLVLTNSDWVRLEIIEQRGLPLERVACLYNGIDLNRFHPDNRKKFGWDLRRELGLHREKIVVLFVANNYRLKGLTALFEAMRLLKRDNSGFDLHLIIAGKHRPGIPFGLRDRVTYVGPQREIERYYAAADIQAHPTFFDPCSNACLEALASGVPIITTAWNGASELIFSGREGFVYSDPAEVEPLRDALLAMSEKKRRLEMGRVAREAVDDLSIDNYLDNFETILRRVADFKPIQEMEKTEE
jgi:UDP-glucose:(heptosyl)LPS alpha-1,3-glucosyltransferase